LSSQEISCMTLQPKALFRAMCLTFALMSLVACASMPQTSDQLKALFNTPLMLLVMMLIASLFSAAKQLVVARRSGQPMTLAEYFLRVETVIMLGHNVGAWLVLLFNDQLNIAAALGAGYVANDAADAYTKEGRSAGLQPPLSPQSPTPNTP